MLHTVEGFLLNSYLPLLIYCGLAIALLTTPHFTRRIRLITGMILALAVVLLIQDFLSEQSSLQVSLMMQHCFAFVGYVLRPFLLVLFWALIATQYETVPRWILPALLALSLGNLLIYCLSFVTHLVFYFDQYGFHRGPLGLTAYVVCLLELALLSCFPIAFTRTHRRYLLPLLLFVPACILLGTALDFLDFNHPDGISFLNLSIAASCCIYFFYLHLQFVLDHEEALQAEQRIRIMISQIQPHFLYNTLSTIQVLCETDPQLAARTTSRFARYLRQNLDSLQQAQLIPLQQELEHTRLYTEIEQLRFPEIQVETDIQDADFMLPALTIQPLVENAIRHGIRGLAPGIVKISTALQDGTHVITIRDNGRGFDPAAPLPEDTSHIGIRNVRDRLQSLVGGTLELTSAPGSGTTVIIRICKNREEAGRSGSGACDDERILP